MENNYNQVEDKSITLLSCDCYCTNEDAGWTENIGSFASTSDCAKECNRLDATFSYCLANLKDTFYSVIE